MITYSYNTLLTFAVLLYDCSALAFGCSSCTHLRVIEGLECGWCVRASPSHTNGTCSYTGSCHNVVEGFPPVRDSLCPAPTIIDFYPKAGPVEGGTTLTITGKDLGVTFDDFLFNSSSITVGGTPCMPITSNYIPGRQIKCLLHQRLSHSGSNNIMVTLHTGQTTSDSVGQFKVLVPMITGVHPDRGPAAGGTNITLRGSNLDIGNIENTQIILPNGLECYVQYVGLLSVY